MLYTTLVKGENGKIYDLSKFQFLPDNVMAVNAWVELVKEDGQETIQWDKHTRKR